MLACALYDLLGDELKMGLVTLTCEAKVMMWELKEKISSAPLLTFPNFGKPSYWKLIVKGRAWSSTFTETRGWMLPPYSVW